MNDDNSDNNDNNDNNVNNMNTEKNLKQDHQPEQEEKTEREKMLSGELYKAFDKDLLRDRQRAKDLCFQLNQTNPLNVEKRKEILFQLFPNRNIINNNVDNNVDNNNSNDNSTAAPPSTTTSPTSTTFSFDIWVESPFHVDYGKYLIVGNNFYANHGCTILDCNYITIGDNCLLAPHVCISAATHPVDDPILRASGAEYTAPITIGNNVWIGANATICPGVTLGDNVVVGAGAVVTKNFPSNVVIGGVPAKIIRQM